MKKYSLFILLFFLSIRAGASCKKNLLPLDERIKIADSIFVGVVLRQERLKVPTESYNAFADVSVKRVFKGGPGKQIRVYYMLDSPKFGCGDKEVLASLSYPEKLEMLFFVKLREGVNFTAQKMGTYTAKAESVAKEIQELPNLIKNRK